MSDLDPISPATRKSASQAWLRALKLIEPVSRNCDRIMPRVIEELAAQWGDAPALLSDRECMTYADLAARQNQYARWALAQKIKKGDVVCLLMPNRPEYLAIWLGISSIGGVTALLNTNLKGKSLAHSISVVRPTHVIASPEYLASLEAVLADLDGSPTLWSHGFDYQPFRRIDLDVAELSSDVLTNEERASLTISDQALYIFTSGTTGLPKGARISHARVLQWCSWFAGMLDAQSTDRIYNCLPMYHSIGGVLVPGAVLLAGGSVVIREKFSSTRFWEDVRQWDCTLFQYIGELCRYLVNNTDPKDAIGHRIRIACGNGMAPDVWDRFKDKFQIPKILEFYASTEGGVSLFNVEEKHGAIGRVPRYLAHRLSPELVRFDYDSGLPVRDEAGRCIRCSVNETGEALGRLSHGNYEAGTKFDGYSDAEESDKKILRDVFEPGDAWIRTGDLMRKDEQGFYYFVDRVGDTFRWKGENVATSEVSEAICAYPGVKHANVYGVSVPATEGAAGMAALVTEGEIDLARFRSHLESRLPAYARPIFVRMRGEIEVTGTFKYSKADLKRDGYNPSMVRDQIYFDSQEKQTFVPLDRSLYERIQDGKVRL